MALSQLQIIQSLGEAMNWLEKELSWGATPAELRYLMGRIGELYVAMYTNGNLAEHVNEKGYDVVTKDNERISVKTTTRTSSQGHILFNPNTLHLVDRAIILRFNEEEMELEILFDETMEEARKLMVGHSSGKLLLAMSKIYRPNRKVRNDSEISVSRKAVYQTYIIQELESGTIEVFEDNIRQSIVKPILKEIAGSLSVSTFNSKGNPYNTGQLGTLIIRELNRE